MTNELTNTREEYLKRINAQDEEYGTDRINVFSSLPRIEIDNRSYDTEVTLPDGRKVVTKLLCQPQFITVGGKDVEYEKEPFADKFTGIILASTYKIIRKGDVETIKRFPNFYHSLEFFNYDGEPVVIKSGDKESYPMSWKSFSEMYAKTYIRYTYIYILVGEKLYILAVKSESGRELLRYKAMLKKAGSNSILHETVFDLETDKTGEIHYNKLKLSSAGEIKDEQIEAVVNLREDLLKTIRDFNKPKDRNVAPAYEATKDDVNMLASAGIISKEQSETIINEVKSTSQAEPDDEIPVVLDEPPF